MYIVDDERRRDLPQPALTRRVAAVRQPSYGYSSSPMGLASPRRPASGRRRPRNQRHAIDEWGY